MKTLLFFAAAGALGYWFWSQETTQDLALCVQNHFKPILSLLS
jgi:hypothetical protein